MSVEHEVRQSGANVDANVKWIAYFSADHRVLWSEAQGIAQAKTDASSPSDPEFPQTPETIRMLDAAIATRMPQCGLASVHLDGEIRRVTVKSFPDFNLNGQFKGVIQVIEREREERRGHDSEVQTVLDLTLCGVLLYSPEEDRILNANRRAAQQTGYPVREMEAMRGCELFGEAAVRRLQTTFKRMGQAGKNMIWGQMLSVHNRDGESERYYCSLRFVPARAEEGAPAAMLISMDTAKRNAVTGAVNDKPNPRFVVEALQDGMWEYDTQTRLFRYSASFAGIFGPEGLPGGPGKTMDQWMETLHPGDPDMIMFNWRLLLKMGQRFQVQYRVRDVRGAWRWIMSTVHAILNDQNGRPMRVIGFHTDITQAIRTERDLVDAEERLRLIFENAGIGMAVSNTDGSLAQINPALALMLGRDRDSIVGRWLTDFCHPEDRPDMRTCLQRLLRGGRREILGDRRFLRPDGRVVWVNITATLSHKVSDGERYVIIMAEDVTKGHESRERLQYEATHDVMTGAWRRWVALERLGQHINLSQRHNQPMAFCLCDIDYFKAVNDKFGHLAGDAVLTRFVELLGESVRDSDVIGRYGGEEFAIVFPNTTVEGAVRSMERALQRIRSDEFTAPSGASFRITATFGVTGVTTDCTVKSTVAMADAALYEGKQAGRNQVVTAHPPPGKAWL